MSAMRLTRARRFGLALAGMLLLLATDCGMAQQRRESLKITMQLSAGADTRHSTITVRFWNVADHVVNLWMPHGVWCRPAPGAVSLEWKFEPADGVSHRLFQVNTNCGELAPGASDAALVDRIAKQHRTWMHLAPGQFVEFQDSILTAALSSQPGKYELRAVYTSPTFSKDDKRILRGESIDTPKGRYTSEAVEILIPGK